MSEAYYVPCAEAESEFTEKRSRFIGRVARVEGSDYGADVSVTLRLPQERTEAFAAALTELSGGGISPEMLGTTFLPGARET